MEQSVVLTKFRKEGSFNFNNRVPVLPPVAAETENFQEQKSRFTPEVSMAVEATSQPALALAANTQVELPSSPQRSPQPSPRTNHAENLGIHLLIEHSQGPSHNEPSLEHQNAASTSTVAKGTSEDKGSDAESMCKDSTNEVQETGSNQEDQNRQLSPGPLGRRMAVCNETDNAESERRRMRVYQKRF